MTDAPITPTADVKPLETPPVAKLADLELATINMVVTLMDGAEVTLPMKMLPQFRMMEITTAVPDPLLKAPLKDWGKGGVPILDEEDRVYLAEKERTTFLRNSIIIAESLLIDIPGSTPTEKAEYVREKFDPLVLEQITMALQIQRQKAKARIIARAATFPR